MTPKHIIIDIKETVRLIHQSDCMYPNKNNTKWVNKVFRKISWRRRSQIQKNQKRRLLLMKNHLKWKPKLYPILEERWNFRMVLKTKAFSWKQYFFMKNTLNKEAISLKWPCSPLTEPILWSLNQIFCIFIIMTNIPRGQKTLLKFSPLNHIY